ncbi:SMI1/KNR4 family protein [Pseudobacillus badius]|uniref:SMI1/KNR4 family protein n=1 Tax=Bacillus badius TaxID=1455 RepID=UPI0007B0A9B8|nr:SMI1/KNR4 family protein [Bacillus badius]KZN98586.1 hypothetical protein A4244_19535 [Bacillus badius]OCS83476.1 hypothetical protein A6M11_19550 [Bacillus badius]OVE46896.1 SMI1/KNR4 family protein [Bacillus badius]TDV98853.1 SMI1/KNR4 family protein SUKH-1 [Bacillus badius]
MSLLNLTMSGLMERIKKGKIHIQQEFGYISEVKFRFNNGTKEKKILEMEKRLNITFPEDYKEFLFMHDGAHLFIDEQVGTRFELLSLNEINEYRSYMDYPDGWYPIAYGFEGNTLLINSNGINKTKRANDYLFWMEEGGPFDDVVALDMTFEMWLDYFIVSQGTKFWEWKIYDSESFYKANDLDED